MINASVSCSSISRDQEQDQPFTSISWDDSRRLNVGWATLSEYLSHFSWKWNAKLSIVDDGITIYFLNIC